MEKEKIYIIKLRSKEKIQESLFAGSSTS